MATTESELENINSLTNEIRDAAEGLDPRKLGLGDLIQSVRDSQRNDADIRANIQRSLQNEEINANNIRGLNSLLQDSLESQNRILQEIKTLATSIDSMSESLSNAANNNGVGPNNQTLGGVPTQGGNMASLGSLLGAGAIGATGATGLGFISNLFGGSGTALMGDANASTISSNQNVSHSNPSYASGITTSGNSAAVGEVPGIGSNAEEYVKRNLGGFTTKGKRESAGMLHEGNLSLEDLITSSDPGTTMGTRINVPYTNPETGKNRFASERYHNPGAKWPSSRDDLFGGMGYNVLRDGEGNKIAAFPTNIHGTAAMFSNMENAGYLGLSGRQFATRWRGRDSAVPNTITQNGGVFTREMLQNRDLMIQLAAEMQQHEGTLTPLTPQELGMGYDMYTAGGATPYFKDNPEAVNYMKRLLSMKQQSNSGQSISQIASNLQQQQVPNQLTSNLEMPQAAQMPEGASQQPAVGSTGGGPGTDAVSASPSIAEDPMSKYKKFTGTVANLSDGEKQQLSKLQKIAKLAGISEQSVGLMEVMNNPAELKKYINGLSPEDREKILGDLDKLSKDEKFKPSEGLKKVMGQVQGILQEPSQAQERQSQEESEGGGAPGAPEKTESRSETEEKAFRDYLDSPENRETFQRVGDLAEKLKSGNLSKEEKDSLLKEYQQARGNLESGLEGSLKKAGVEEGTPVSTTRDELQNIANAELKKDKEAALEDDQLGSLADSVQARKSLETPDNSSIAQETKAFSERYRELTGVEAPSIATFNKQRLEAQQIQASQAAAAAAAQTAKIQEAAEEAAEEAADSTGASSNYGDASIDVQSASYNPKLQPPISFDRTLSKTDPSPTEATAMRQDKDTYPSSMTA